MIRFSPGVCRRFAAFGVASLWALLVGCAAHDNSSQTGSSAPDISFSEPSRDLEPPSKLAPALQTLASASETSRDLSPSDDGTAQVPSPDEIGYPAPGTTDVFEVAIHVAPEADVKAIAAAGANIQMRLGNTLYATVHARDLAQVAEVDGVQLVAPMPGGTIPMPPKVPLQASPQDESSRDLEAGNGDAAKFDHQGLTGKGVIVGIVDTGIDWRHQDFMNPDGSSRILYLWDIFDNSWEDSKHAVGSKPPMTWDEGKPMGTVYTNTQINAAIKGQIKIPRTDSMGHGTACAGTAAGDDLGVAPEADLVIVDTYMEDAKNPDNDGACGVQGAAWITQIAAERHEPCVISLSFGGHDASHDGNGEQEDGFNQVVNGGEAKGVVICASAGNEGQDSMHARGRFGPGRPNELNGGFGEPVQLFVAKETVLGALFDSRDDFKLRILGLDKFLVGSDQKPGRLDFFKGATKSKSGDYLQIAGSNNLSQADQNNVRSLRNDNKIYLKTLTGGTDAIIVVLPPGAYYVDAAGNSDKVTHGVYDLYLPDISNASFGSGGDHKMVVGSPGDADDVITVGSYDFRNEWDNADGTTTHCGRVDMGNISDYSSEGFRRDGVVKPDIAAPGEFTISAMSAGCKLAEDMGGSVAITKDGKHVAWAGTSASCPYTAGVVALMLEKNPQLTANQVKQILRDTADHDLAVTGAVPNSQWGYGKLNPDKAMASVPAVAAAPPSTEPSPIAGPAPIVTPALKSGFAGTFKGDGLVVVLVANADGSFAGSMVKGDQTFPIAAHLVAGQLEGSVSSQGKDFPFAATLDGDKLTLRAGDKTFNLKRQDAPRGMGADWLQRSISPQDDAGATRDLGAELAFKPTEIDDPMINNWPAYTLLVPDAWHFEGSIHWNQDPWTMVSPVVLAHAPGGFPGVMVYPQGSFVDGIRQQRMQMYAPVGGAEWMAQAYAEGKIYLGKEIRVFAQPVDYIKRFVIPLYRKDLGEAQVAGVEDAPKFAKMVGDSTGVGNGQGTRVDAVKVRFQYEFKGQPIDEDMYCAVTSVQMPGGVVCWTGNVISFVAPGGTMDKAMPILTTIVASAKPQLKWVNACAQVSQMMQQNIAQAIADEGMLSRYIAKVSDDISEMGRESYEERVKVEDKVAQEWHEYIMGIAPYNTPNGGPPVELPNTGNHWYVDPNGCYHQTVPGGPPPENNWTELEPAQG